MADRNTVRFEMLVDVDWRAGTTLRDWMRIGLEAFGGELARAAWTRTLLEAPSRKTYLTGRPGQVWCDLHTSRTPTQQRATPTTPLSTEAWSRFLARAGELPDQARIRLATFDHTGYPHSSPGCSIHSAIFGPAELQRESAVVVDRKLLQLKAYVPGRWLTDRSFQEAVTNAWLEVAHQANPRFGEIAFGSYWSTELESHLRGGDGNSQRNMLHSRERLRGYGWLTLCPQQLGEQLGGRHALQSSFARVVELDSGGLWLQATESYVDYDMDAAERVYRALAPVLISGQPFVLPSDHPCLLVPEDPRPAPQRPDRGYTKPRRPKNAPPIPSFTLHCLDDQHWELWHNGEPCSGWEHDNPKYVRILAEVLIADETGLPVLDWQDLGDGTTRALLADGPT